MTCIAQGGSETVDRLGIRLDEEDISHEKESNPNYVSF